MLIYFLCNSNIFNSEISSVIFFQQIYQVIQVDNEKIKILIDEKVLFPFEDLELLFEIGHGHFGVVHKAIIKYCNKEVAVETINSSNLIKLMLLKLN